MNRLAVISGSRADFGLLTPVIRKLEASSVVAIDLIATGSHFDEAHGMSIQEIYTSGLSLATEISITPASDTPADHAQALGSSLSRFAEAYEELKTKAVLVLGDRTEIMIASFASIISGIPVVHIHGGELTLGAIDDAIRHSVSKMSSLHFTSNEVHRKRVIQMGEAPDTVINSGALGAENAITKDHKLNWEQLKVDLTLDDRKDLMVVTFHPATAAPRDSRNDLNALLKVLEMFEDWNLLFSGTNNDQGSMEIRSAIEEFTSKRENARFVPSLGSEKYLAALSKAKIVVGNSSSGLIEAPALRTPTVNIGSRQGGRFSPPSVYDSRGSAPEIREQIEKALRHEWSQDDYDYGYSIGNELPSEIIVSAIENRINSLTVQKSFFDFSFPVNLESTHEFPAQNSD